MKEVLIFLFLTLPMGALSQDVDEYFITRALTSFIPEILTSKIANNETNIKSDLKEILSYGDRDNIHYIADVIHDYISNTESSTVFSGVNRHKYVKVSLRSAITISLHEGRYSNEDIKKSYEEIRSALVDLITEYQGLEFLSTNNPSRRELKKKAAEIRELISEVMIPSWEKLFDS